MAETSQMIIVGLGLFTGLIMGLSGAGGSILAIPLLVIGLNLELTQAAPIALLAIMSAALVGAIQGLIKGNVRYKAALLIGGFGIAVAPLGFWLAKRVPTLLLSACLAAIMLYVAWRMWHQYTDDAVTHENRPPAPCEINPATTKLFWTAYCTKRLIATGAAAGLLSGLLGVGGGFVIVPSLRKVRNFDFQTIIATSLAVIALVSAGSVAIHLQQGVINWAIALPFVISAVISMLASRFISHKIPTMFSQRAFSMLAVIAAASILLKAFA
jgi:uncharacterized membrane protein YfcA